MPESPEEIDFEVERDVTAEQKKALFDKLEEYRELEDWIGYLDLYAKMKLYWPDMPGEENIGGISTDQVRRQLTGITNANELHLWPRAAANLRSLGLPIKGIFDPGFSGPSFLSDFDARLNRGSIDITLAADALIIARLGLRLPKEVFPNPQQGWELYTHFLEIFREGERRNVFAKLGGEMKLLFPQRVDEIPISAAEIKRLKGELRRTDPATTGVVMDYVLGVSLLNAGEAQLGPRGEYMIKKRAVSPTPSPKLPERNLA